jgi:hypothetical protein
MTWGFESLKNWTTWRWWINDNAVKWSWMEERAGRVFQFSWMYIQLLLSMPVLKKEVWLQPDTCAFFAYVLGICTIFHCSFSIMYELLWQYLLYGLFRNICLDASLDSQWPHFFWCKLYFAMTKYRNNHWETKRLSTSSSCVHLMLVMIILGW